MNKQRKLKLRLSDAKALSKQLEDAMTDIKDEIVSCVAQQPQKGRLVNDSPRVFTLKLAELENGVLSAEYYDVNAQSRAVKKTLSSAQTPEDIEKRVANMSNKRYVTTNSQTKTPLNENTLRTLKETGLAEKGDTSNE